MYDPKATSQSTAFLVTIPSFIGTNWYEFKSHMEQLIATHIGSAGIPLSYTIKDTCQYWEDTKTMASLQDMITATNMHSGNSFDIENKELFRIISNTFFTTTLAYFNIQPSEDSEWYYVMEKH